MEDYRDFGEKLRYYRKRAGLSQRFLASTVGFTASYISQIEVGRRHPPRRKIVILLSDELFLTFDERNEFLIAADYSPFGTADLTEEEFIAIGEIDGKIRLVLLGKDGTFRFVDGTQQIHSLLYIVSSETIAMREAVEELEYLMNSPRVTERDFQEFFERNPRLILNDEYKKAHPHIVLTREEGTLIPDFLLEPLEQGGLADILDLKLPTTKIFVLKKNRPRFSAAVMEACAQLREYGHYFDDRENRKLIYRKYGLKAYKPKMIVIIGRRGDVDPIQLRKIGSDLPHLELRTYDDVIIRAKSRLGH